MPPAEELAGHHFVNASLAEEHAEDSVAKEVLHRVQINLRERHTPIGRTERAVGHQGV